MPDQDLKSRLQNWIPKLVLSPSLALTFVFVYGFILFTLYLSFTNSRMLPNTDFVGLANYERLWGLRAWWVAIKNLAVFSSLYIVICIVTKGRALRVLGEIIVEILD